MSCGNLVKLIGAELAILSTVMEEGFRKAFADNVVLHEQLQSELESLTEQKLAGEPGIEQKMVLSFAIVSLVKLRNAASLLLGQLPPRRIGSVSPETEKVEELEAALRVLALWLPAAE